MIILRQFQLLLNEGTNSQVSPPGLSKSRGKAGKKYGLSGSELSDVSGSLRLCLNVLFVMTLVNQGEEEFMSSVMGGGLLESLAAAVSVCDCGVVPVRKVTIFIEKLLVILFQAPDSDLYLPPNNPVLGENQVSPLATLLSAFPLSLPSLDDFRSFVALAMHQYTLLNWTPPTGTGVFPRPAAIDEGIGIIDKYLIEFITEYSFHEVEIEYVRRHDFLARAQELLLKHRTKKKTRSNLLKPSSMHRFSVSEIARNMIPNYQLASEGTRMANVSPDGPESDGGESSCDEVNLPLVNEAYESCYSWLGEDEEVIDAIAEAVVPVNDGTVYEQEKYFAELVGDSSGMLDPNLLQEMVVSLLKILLSACRGGSTDVLTSPTQHPALDRDLDYLKELLIGLDIAPNSNEGQTRRNLESISAAVTGILLLLIKYHSDSARIQQTIVANNGCLVLLKIITRVPENCGEILIPHAFSSLPQLRGNKSWALGVPVCQSLVVFRALRTLYWLCHRQPSRIKKFLIHYKLAIVLKRFFQCPNVAIQKIAYRLFKIQIRYLNRKWKFLHIKLISCCYAAVETAPIEDWLTHDPELMVNANDSFLSESAEAPLENPTEYAADLKSLNFASETEIHQFCRKHGQDRKGFFMGCASLGEFIESGIGV